MFERFEFPANAVAPMGCSAAQRIVCGCFQVSENRVHAAIAQGCASVEAITDATAAGGGCTCCHRRLQKMIDATRE